MKKIFVLSISLLVLFFCSCNVQKHVNYVTKYVANCETTPFRTQPSNDGDIISILNNGQAVSFECDAANGYSKVVYDGNTGYVLSVNLELVKPTQSNNTVPSQNTNTVQPNTQSMSQYEKIMSNAAPGDIEKYITDYVRPYYYKVNDNIDSYNQKTDGNKKIWYSGKEVVKMELAKGSNGYNYSRQYYFDETTGNLIFAFVFDGTTEYRLYFDVDRIMRFIDSNGNIFDNPKSIDALKMAEFVLGEAYVR